ncbi:Anti-sigma-L factor RslA [Streptomyces sp. YIM 121038]|nr:Anti-sigma-L factor RslA [Streptomyces sp. YIM 121038]
MPVSGSGDGHVELLLGAYVLGGLSPAECRGVAAHIAACDSCRTAHRELSDAPAFLSLLSDAELSDGLGLSDSDPPGGAAGT